MVQTIHMPKKLIQGVGTFQQLIEVSLQLRMNHLFVMVSQRNHQEMNTITSMVDELNASVTFFHKKTGEPTTEDLSISVDAFLKSGANGIVAIGGGSILDLAKATAVIAKNKHLTIADLQNEMTISGYPLIAMPTTAGTGSEVTKVSVITDSEKHIKYNPGHPDLIPDVVILDPQLTVTMPKHITAQTGMDAFAHALEAFVSTKANGWTNMFALEAMQLISENLPIVYDDPENLKAREKMLYASSLAGMAFSNSSTNLAHATARALGAKLNIPHGLSVAIMLPPVIEFTMEVTYERYQQVADMLGVDDMVDYVHSLNNQFNLYVNARQLIQINQLQSLIPTLVTDALSGNGILTNRKIPTKKETQQVFEKMILNIQEEL